MLSGSFVDTLWRFCMLSGSSVHRSLEPFQVVLNKVAILKSQTFFRWKVSSSDPKIWINRFKVGFESSGADNFAGQIR